jgi:F0F1-type ATP synthase assembly protein I
MREAAPFIGVGSTMAAALGLRLAAGYWLDARMGTRPWFLLLGSGLGMFAGFYHLFKLVSGQKKK